MITNVPDSSASMQEEIFGPVVCISSFKTEEEVIQGVIQKQFSCTGEKIRKKHLVL